MNQRPTGLNVTKAITGFLQYQSAEVLSPVTLSGYNNGPNVSDVRVPFQWRSSSSPTVYHWVLYSRLPG